MSIGFFCLKLYLQRVQTFSSFLSQVNVLWTSDRKVQMPLFCRQKYRFGMAKVSKWRLDLGAIFL